VLAQMRRRRRRVPVSSAFLPPVYQGHISCETVEEQIQSLTNRAQFGTAP
jgi:hypothetical protein